MESFFALLVEFKVLFAVLALSFVEELSASLVLSFSLSPVVADELLVDILSPVVEVLGPAHYVASVSDVLFEPDVLVLVSFTVAALSVSEVFVAPLVLEEVSLAVALLVLDKSETAFIPRTNVQL